MKDRKTFTLILTSLGLILFASACGGQPYAEPAALTPPPSSSGGSSGGGSGGSGGISTNFTPAITFSFSVTGSGGTSPAYVTPIINTDNILKVKISTGMSDRLSIPTYSNFTANYNCVTYTVTALGKSVTTEPLSPNEMGSPLCPNASDSQVIDFSDRLGPGHGPVTITVDRTRYDFYCQLWTQCQADPFSPTCYYSFYPATHSMYCPLRTVYRNHTVTGNLAIQVNGSSL